MNQGLYLILLFLLVDFRQVFATHFRGGSISWRSLNSTSVEIRYWFAWRHDFEESGHDHCTEVTHHNHTVLRFGEDLKYKSEADTSYTPVYDIKYVCSDHNPDFGWVAGVGAFNYTSTTPEFTISLQTCCWIRLENYDVPRNIRLTTGINLTEYSSRGNINNSPLASTVPLQRIQQQCNALIKIAVSDPDGDTVKCRWANKLKDDCDEVCGKFAWPIRLFKKACVLSFAPVQLAPGYYAVTVMVEDFINTTSNKALSKVPIQFLLEVYASDRSCQRPEFVSPTPAAGLCVPIAAGQDMQMTIAARNSDTSRPIADIASVGTPQGMTKSTIGLLAGSTSDYSVVLNWTPPDDYEGNKQMCFIAQDHGNSEDSQHYASEQTCVTLNVGGSLVHVVPEQSTPSPGQTVAPTTSAWTIVFDHEIRLPDVPAFVTFLDSSGQALYTVSVDDSSESTHVMLMPSGMGIGIDTPEFNLDSNTNYTIRVHQGVAENVRRGCGHVLSELAEWNFRTGDTDLSEQNPGDPDTIRLARPKSECRSSYMVTYVPRALVGDIDPTTMHLEDASCIGAYQNESHYSIGSAYEMCNTQVHETDIEGEPAFQYENIIHIPSQPYRNGSFITRTHHIEIHVSCELTNQRPVFAEFNANITTIVYHEIAYGEFEFSLYMCTDDSFTDKFKRGDFPVDVDLRQRLYFESRLYNIGDTGLFLQSCRATPTANPLDHIYYEFIKNGCPVDDTTVIHDAPNVRKARFSIEAFAFLGHFVGSTVFIHCDMSVCMLSDPSCIQMCEETEDGGADGGPDGLGGLPISKRDVADGIPTSLAYTNTDGPIRIKAGIKGPSASHETNEATTQPWYSEASVVQISLMTLSLCILIFLLMVLMRVHILLRLGMHQQRKAEPKLRDPVTLNMAVLSKQ
ncbi:uncharacterized protein [Amphiura filiformis]|uniref:uncharacterized protein n=1 Tax=Amphiura filiformis TaxID=82378 RepID=UPI003B225140